MNEDDFKYIDKQLPEENKSTESPLVWFTNFLSPKGYEESITVRANSVKEVFEKRYEILAVLEDKGCSPIKRVSKGFTPQPVSNTTQPTKDAPLCGIHGVAMNYRSPGISKATGKPYNGFWACPEKNADGSFCRYKPEV